MNKLMIAVAASVLSAEILAAPGLIRTASEAVKGDIKWQNGSKTYAVTKGKITREFKPEDVVTLDIDRPELLDRAIQLVQRKQSSQAIVILDKLVKDYRKLVWDKVAARYLLEAYRIAKNPQKGYEAARSLISDDETAAWSGPMAPAYWNILLDLGKKVQLEDFLDKAASSGERVSSAFALIMRGDMILNAEGETFEACRRALIDGYLRVALMYTDSQCVEARATAMEKAAKCFAKLSMPGRAEKFRAEARRLSQGS
jgi:hypothetical protein